MDYNICETFSPSTLEPSHYNQQHCPRCNLKCPLPSISNAFSPEKTPANQPRKILTSVRVKRLCRMNQHGQESKYKILMNWHCHSFFKSDKQAFVMSNVVNFIMEQTANTAQLSYKKQSHQKPTFRLPLEQKCPHLSSLFPLDLQTDEV